jgi:allantoinase
MSDSSQKYPRDFVGYGRQPPHAQWPGAARIAIQFVLNHEEGAENCVLDGDAASETFLSEIIGAQAFPMRHMSIESLFEYGSRAGLWRVLRAFERRKTPLTVFAAALALKRHPEAVAAYHELGHEIAGHGLRWISYQLADEVTERAHLAEAVAILNEVTGASPLGWYTGRDSPNTRRLVVEHGGFVYDSDSYADDLPYWTEVTVNGSDGMRAVPHLVVPYTLDCNDMRFATAQGFNSGTQFFDYARDSFDTLYREGDPAGLNAPRMLSVGLHARLIGRPGRIAALERFLDYVLEHDHVWVCRRIDIARHWISRHPPNCGTGARPTPDPKQGDRRP